jgi:hypothetical protein
MDNLYTHATVGKWHRTQTNAKGVSYNPACDEEHSTQHY